MMIYQELYSRGMIIFHRQYIQYIYLFIYLYIYAVCFFASLKICVRVFSDHLLRPSSRLWNNYIQLRGCDWWRDGKRFFYPPQPKKGPPINQRRLRGATQINKEGFFSLQLQERVVVVVVGGGPSEKPYEKTSIIHSVLHTYIYIHITQAEFTGRERKDGRH